MASTYEPISTQTLSSPASSITFSSIPATYTDLVIVGNYFVTGPTNRLTAIRVGTSNTIDTASNYSTLYMGGNGSSAFAGLANTSDAIYGPNHYDNWATSFIHILSYRNTNFKKTILSRGGTSSGNTGQQVGGWNNTAAIDTVRWEPNGDNFGTGSTFTLYGILAA
jgi:hypothetical protein